MRVYDILNEIIEQIKELRKRLGNVDFSSSSKGFIDFVYPIGSFYITSSSDNPSKYFGGTWIKVNNAFLYSVGDEALGNALLNENITADGGVTTNTLTADNIPAHTHGSAGSHNHGQSGNHGHTLANVGYHADRCAKGSLSTVCWRSYAQSDVVTYGEGGHVHSTDGGHTHGSFGKSNPDAINNMPPYLKVYVWKRTA